MAVELCGLEIGGLQDMAAVAREDVRLESITLFATATISGPSRQVFSHPLFAVLLFMVFARVAASLCPSAFSLQVALSCPLRNR